MPTKTDKPQPRWGKTKALKAALEQKGWSRSELARQTNMNASSISLIFNGRMAAYPTQYERISEALGYPVNGLFEKAE